MTSRHSISFHEQSTLELSDTAVGDRNGAATVLPLPLINCDHVSLLVCCPVSGTDYEYFLGLSAPYSTYGLIGTRPVVPGESWKVTVDTIFKNSKVPLKPEGIIRIDRWFVPGIDRMSSHVVYVTLIKPESKKFVAAAYAGVWLSTAQMKEYGRDQKLLCPDVQEIISSACVTCVTGIQVAAGNELTAEHFVRIDPSDTTKKVGFDSIVAAAQFFRPEQETLYRQFMFYAVPYFTLGRAPFIALMKQIGWPDQMLPNLFRTFDLHGRGGLTFRDLLYGLAAIEPSTPHGGAPAEIRCRYIFRFYDRNGDGRLDFEEFKGIVADIRQARGLPYDPIAIQAEASQSARTFNSSAPGSLTLVEFLTAVGQLKFRGTSHLLRSSVAISIFLKTKHPGIAAATSPRPLTPLVSRHKSVTSTVMDVTRADELSSLFETYDIASHSVKVRKSGTILNINSLWDIEHSGISGQAQHSRLQIGPDVNRLQSIDRFNQDTQHNEMLNGLRFFQRSIPSDAKGGFGPKPPYDWGEVDRESLAKCVLILCQQVREIMSAEPRLLEIPSPCYILGDIHGNFPDLLAFEKALWRLGPMLTPSSFLFLGDYVDRGIYGVEVVSYLFAQKVIAPSKFYLLRGNHEIREVQQMFTFFKECILKFGEKSGRDIWEAVNLAFDCMPLAAVVDKKVFCVHGGIPPPWIGDGLLEAINSIPCPLTHPEATSALSWELMWGDPLHLEMLTAEQREKLVMRDGFGPNLRRGTAHVFNEDGLDIFLAKNGLSHVVRAHEVQQAGFKVQLKGRLLTVFSSSKYCGGSNEAACILAEKYKLRTIRIDTS